MFAQALRPLIQRISRPARQSCPRCWHPHFVRIASKPYRTGVLVDTHLCRSCAHVEQRRRYVH